jgi:hypothetical protein
MHDFVEIHAARQSEILGDVKWIDQGCVGGRCRINGRTEDGIMIAIFVLTGSFISVACDEDYLYRMW